MHVFVFGEGGLEAAGPSREGFDVLVAFAHERGQLLGRGRHGGCPGLEEDECGMYVMKVRSGTLECDEKGKRSSFTLLLSEALSHFREA